MSVAIVGAALNCQNVLVEVPMAGLVDEGLTWLVSAWEPSPVIAAQRSSASAAANAPDGVALSVGSAGRKISASPRPGQTCWSTKLMFLIATSP